MDIEIREATEADIKEIVRLFAEALQSDYKKFIAMQLIEAFDYKAIEQDCTEGLNNSEKFRFAYVALFEKNIVGYISAGSNTVEPYEYDAEVSNIIVKSDFQNGGIGKKLMYKAIIRLEECGYSSFVVFNFSKSKANGFYRNLNGKLINRLVQDDYEEACVDIFGWQIKEIKSILL